MISPVAIYVHTVHAKADALWRGMNSLRLISKQLKERNSQMLLNEKDREILAMSSQLSLC